MKETAPIKVPEQQKDEETSWVSALRERIQKVFERKDVELPPIDFDIFYSPHGSEIDAMGLKEKFASADVYFPENVWVGPIIKAYRELSEGEMKPDEFVKNFDNCGFAKYQAEMIYGSNKPIGLIDIPLKSKIGNKLLELYKEARGFASSEIILSGDFSLIINWERETNKKWVQAQQEREEYMIAHLAPRLKEILSDRPDLQKKARIKVLLSLGSGHTTIYHTLKKEGKNVSRTFRSMPVIFGFDAEVSRRIKFSKEITDELLAHAAFEHCFYATFSFLLKFTYDNDKKGEFVRHIVSQFTFEEIKKIFEEDIPRDGVHVSTEKACHDKNIPEPTPEVINSFFESNKKKANL